MYAIVDSIDAVHRRGRFLRSTKGEGEHGSQGVPKPDGPTPPSVGERAVIGYSLGDQGMGDLEEDRAAPPGQEHDLPVELAGDTTFDPDATGERPDRLEGMSHSGIIISISRNPEPGSSDPMVFSRSRGYGVSWAGT